MPDVVAVEPLALRELRAVREIAHAFLVADAPGDVYQFALSRVTPLLGAAFSLIMQLGEDGELLRPVAQHEWPTKHRHWIGALRVRVGDGPSGVAVAERMGGLYPPIGLHGGLMRSGLGGSGGASAETDLIIVSRWLGGTESRCCTCMDEGVI